MLCALSGKDAVEPVASAVSGKVYERALIETWIAERGTDPATGAPLSAAQLVRLDLAPAAAAVTGAASIPALLGGLQTEFNALALENFELRQLGERQRAELDDAHYRVEAALRVITRLTQERDELRHALEQLDADFVPPAAPRPQNQNHSPVARGQGNAGARDNAPPAREPQTSDSPPGSPPGSPSLPSPPLPSLSSHMDVEENDALVLDVLGASEPRVPPAPRIARSSAAWNDVAAARRALTGERRAFNAAAAQLALATAKPRLLATDSGDTLHIHAHWAIVADSSRSTLLDLRVRTPVRFAYDHPVRHMSFLDDDTPRLALLAPRRLAILDLASNTVVKEATVPGNPLAAVRHPAGPLLVHFATKIAAFDADTLAPRDDLSVSVAKLLAFAVHPDGDYVMYTSGAHPKKLVFYSLLKREEVLAVDTAAAVRSIAASANGYHVAYVDGDAVAVLDLRNDDPPVKLRFANTELTDVSFDSTGRRLYVPSADRVLTYMPQESRWDEQGIHSDKETLAGAWSGQNLQVPVLLTRAAQT